MKVEETELRVYIPQYKTNSGNWNNHTTKAGNALHKTYNQAAKKCSRGGRVVTYILVEESVEYFGDDNEN